MEQVTVHKNHWRCKLLKEKELEQEQKKEQENEQESEQKKEQINVQKKDQNNEQKKDKKIVIQNRNGKVKSKEEVAKKGLKIIPLGGLEQIGMNITAFEYEDSIFVVDCG